MTGFVGATQNIRGRFGAKFGADFGSQKKKRGLFVLPLFSPKCLESLRWPDSRESIRANHRRVPELNPFLQIAFRGAKALRIEGLRRFARIARTFNVMKTLFFLRIDSRESIRVNRPDSRCE